MSVIAMESLSSVTVGNEYRSTLTSTGNNIKWNINEESELPKGLTLDQDTGVISGTPAKVENYAVIVQTQDILEKK